MDRITTLRGLILHLDWAREKLMELTLPLADDQLDRPFETGMGSLRATLRHLWTADRFWLDVWRLGADAPRAECPDDIAVAALRALFRAAERERCVYLDEMGTAGESTRIDLSLRNTAYSVPLGDLMLHVANHGAHHRAQAMNMLRHIGVKLPILDYLGLCMTPGDRPAVAYDADTIKEYQRYGDWARGRVHTLVRELDDKTIDAAVDMGVGTLRKTLLHIEGAERWWIENWSGTEASAFNMLPDDMPLADIDARFTEAAARRDTFLAGCTNDELMGEVTAIAPGGRHLTFKLGDTMLQLCLHGTYHRAQILNMLRHAEQETLALDYFTWCAQGSPCA